MDVELVFRSAERGIDVYRVAPRSAVRAWLRYEYAPSGKPRIPGGPEISIAHTRELSLVALGGDHAIGVDAERIVPIPEIEGVARLLFGDADRAHLRNLQGAARLVEFYRLWVELEAKVKARGEALSAHGPFDRVETHIFFPAAGIVAALAVDIGTKVPMRAGESSGPDRHQALRSLTPRGYTRHIAPPIATMEHVTKRCRCELQ